MPLMGGASPALPSTQGLSTSHHGSRNRHGSGNVDISLPNTPLNVASGHHHHNKHSNTVPILPLNVPVSYGQQQSRRRNGRNGREEQEQEREGMRESGDAGGRDEEQARQGKESPLNPGSTFG